MNFEVVERRDFRKAVGLIQTQRGEKKHLKTLHILLEVEVSKCLSNKRSSQGRREDNGLHQEGNDACDCAIVRRHPFPDVTVEGIQCQDSQGQKFEKGFARHPSDKIWPQTLPNLRGKWTISDELTRQRMADTRLVLNRLGCLGHSSPTDPKLLSNSKAFLGG